MRLAAKVPGPKGSPATMRCGPGGPQALLGEPSPPSPPKKEIQKVTESLDSTEKTEQFLATNLSLHNGLYND